MRVLLLTSTFPRFHNDMQANFVGEQAAAWIKARPGDEIVVLAPHDQAAPRRETVGQMRVERFRYFVPQGLQRLAYPAILPNLRSKPILWGQVPPFVLAEYLAARRLARDIDADCIYAHWIMPQGIVAWRLKQALGIPYILQNHSSDLAVFSRLGSLGRTVARKVLLGAARFFCVNEGQKAAALALLPREERDAFERKCSVLPMGMTIADEVSEPKAPMYEIATIARLSRKKGLNYLIEAAERLARRGVRPRIGIAGDGEDRQQLEAMVQDANITFVGFLSGKEKEEFLAQSARFAFPSRATGGDVEGLPVALLEALCRGRPVLASRDTNVEMLPEWPLIRDEVAFVADPADIESLAGGIEKLLGSPSEVSPAIARTMDRYRWNRLIEEYLVPIEEVLGS